MNNKYEKSNCLICDSNNNKLLNAIKDWGDKNELLNISICLNCGFIFLNPKRSKKYYANFYKNDYDDYYRTNETNDLIEHKKNLYNKRGQEIIDRVKKYINLKNNVNILDIGAGPGWSLLKFKDFNQKINLHAIESSEQCIKNLKKLKINIIGKGIEITQTDKKFDLIILRHVLEHLDSPLKMLDKIRNMLSEEGIIYIAIPNMDKPIKPITKKWFRMAHISYFNLFIITLLTNKALLKNIILCEVNNEVYGVFKKSNIIENLKLPSKASITKKANKIKQRIIIEKILISLPIINKLLK